MMYGQLATANHGWAHAARQPQPFGVMRKLRSLRISDAAMPVVEIWSRAALGAGIGTAFGLTTAYVAFWFLLGAVAAPTLGNLRDRLQPAELNARH